MKNSDLNPNPIGVSNTAEAIANERENFRNLFRQTPEMVCILSGPEHRFEFVNEAHIFALGFDATGLPVRVAQPESVEVHSILDNVFTTGVTAELHEIPVTLTDRIRYFNLTYSARRDLNGNISGVMILGAEVTGQVQTREILKSQNQSLKMMLDGASLEEVLTHLVKTVESHVYPGVIGSVMLVDEKFEHLLFGAAPSLPLEYKAAVDGIALSEEIGCCGSAALNNAQAMSADIATDPRWEGLHQFAKEHSLKTCWSSPIRSSKNKVIGTFALYNRPFKKASLEERQTLDLITQTAAIVIERHLEAENKKLTEFALKESERLFRSTEEQLSQAIEVAKVGFYDWDIGKNIVTLSKQMRQDWGLPEGTVFSLQDAMSHIHPDDVARVQRLIDDSIQKHQPYHAEYRVIHSNGCEVWVEVKGHIRRDAQGNPLRFFGTSVDITEQKQKEQILRQSQEIAESANAAKGTFLANMSHEIRTPLGAILGFLDLLKNPENSREDLNDYIGVIDRNSKQLMRIVDDILDLSKIEAGKIQIENAEFSLSELLADFNSLMGFKAKEKGLQYVMTLETGIPNIVHSDATRLRQILSNIVGNAIKFTDKGQVHLKLAFQEGILKIAVSDTGRGISPEIAEKLFRPFSQGDESTTRLYGGTGLGLTLTKKLTQALGGNFVLQQSELGKGSVFVATIPLGVLPGLQTKQKSQIDATLSEGRPANTNYLDGVRVLFVDDSPDNQAFIGFMLKRWGAEVEVASNGREGVNKASLSPFDVVLMDVQMPEMDGHQATQELRLRGFSKPIVALTAHAMKEERDRCLDSGFSDFLSKPINKNALLSALIGLRH